MKKFTLLLATLFISIATFADYYVAGSSSLCSSNWSNNDANNKMTLTNGIYVKSYANVPAGSHEFKITNGTWDNSKGAWCVDASTSTPGYTGSDNISFTLLNATNITISYNEGTDKITLKAEGLDRFGTFTINSYTLCGDFPCLDWNTANTTNHMTKGENGIWTKTYENVILDTKTYKYKVAANNVWGQGEFPTSGGNQEYKINEAGAYNLTFTYNPAKPELTCEANLISTAEVVLYPENTTIYVTVHTQWTADNARFAAYFFGANGDTWVNMTNIKDYFYSVVVPEGEWKRAIFCRMNPNNTENRWNNDGEENGPFWGMQTIDIVYEEGKNHYIINSEDQTLDGNKPGGFWTTYKANDTTTTLENTTIANIYTQNGMIVADEEISIFTITGQNVTNLNGKLENGVYIVKSTNATTKVVVK